MNVAYAITAEDNAVTQSLLKKLGKIIKIYGAMCRIFTAVYSSTSDDSLAVSDDVHEKKKCKAGVKCKYTWLTFVQHAISSLSDPWAKAVTTFLLLVCVGFGKFIKGTVPYASWTKNAGTNDISFHCNSRS